jgi:hypothetical protein
VDATADSDFEAREAAAESVAEAAAAVGWWSGGLSDHPEA